MATAAKKAFPTATKTKRASVSAKRGVAKAVNSNPRADKAATAAARAAEKAAQKEAKLAREESDLIAYETTKVLVPLWFGLDSVEKSFRKNRSLPPEAALCLMLIGSEGEESEVGMQMRLRPSGFDRQEAQLLAMMGTASLMGAKLAKRKTGKKYAETKDVLVPNVLTAKGQKLYDLAKSSILSRMKQ